ncbi:MAG: VanW family protein [Clostridiales bacterium]|jgi:vancomycin resistance protein YoaR|nr:VanW family protein [Eubacteriales bacterium]MDH7565133.1 VanW family protein [Clostridiales bacterium]
MLLKFFVTHKKMLAVLLGLSIFFTVFYISMAALMNSKTFYKGISVEDLALGGLSREQAVAAVEKRLNDTFGSRRLSLCWNNQKWEVSFEDISLRFLIDDTLNKAFAIGRKGNLISRLSRIIRLSFDGIDLSTPVDYDREKLYKFLAGIKNEVDLPAKNAAASYRDGKVEITREEVGKSLDIDKNIKLIENYIRERKFDNIALFVEDNPPLVLYDNIKEIGSVIASFSTVFNPGDLNRSYNIGLACSKINGTILLKNDIFSMNKALGPRTIENGYKDAPVIYKDELVPGPGGGVCQVTTTLYDAVLKAKLKIVERTHHSMPSWYVEPGQDATIAGDYIDLKFKNSTDYPVCIAAEVSGNKLIIRILGRDTGEGNVVKLKSQIVEEFQPGEPEYIVDDTVPENTMITVREAKKGLKVVVFRETYDRSGNLIKKETISEDFYKPARAQIKVNENFYNRLKN